MKFYVLTLLALLGLSAFSQSSQQAPTDRNSTPVRARLGGAPVLLMKNVDPWFAPTNETLLSNQGQAYDLATSQEIASLNLSAYQRVIIASDQNQEFYDEFEAHLGRFESYVANGGLLQMNACDQGWNAGNLNQLPGGVGQVNRSADENRVIQVGHPLVSNVTNPFRGNSASHAFFVDYEGLNANVITDDGSGATTLIYHLGQGTVIASGVTLEYAVSNFQADYDELLVNTLNYAPLGTDPVPTLGSLGLAAFLVMLLSLGLWVSRRSRQGMTV